MTLALFTIDNTMIIFVKRAFTELLRVFRRLVIQKAFH